MTSKLAPNNTIPADKWQWFGHAAHFICGAWCRFHMATKVGDYLVSTVGLYVHPRHSSSEGAEAAWLKANPNGERIGCDRFYETFVFKAGAPCKVEGCNCGLPSIDGSEIDTLSANDAGTARENHMKLCRKWAKKGNRQ